jgi:predicted transcriptional regulator
MSKRLLEIAAELVQSQMAGNSVSTDEVVGSLRQVFSVLQRMQNSEVQESSVEFTDHSGPTISGTAAGQVMNPMNSIQDDKIICLECGAEMRQLTSRHLKSHGLTPRAYKQKHNLPPRQPLAAKSLSKSGSSADGTQQPPEA